MLRSMTGYGRAESVGGDYSINAEIRSVNGRFFKAHCKLPPQLTRFESDIEKLLKQHFLRGTIDLYMKYQRISNPGGYTFNAEAARGYWQQIERLKNEFGVGGTASFELLSTLPGVLEAEEESDADIEKLWPHIEGAVNDAAAKVLCMRDKEGAELRKDILDHLGAVEDMIERVKQRIPQSLQDYKARLRERVRQLLDGTDVKVDDQDLAREIVLYIERSNIAEELARTASHIAQFRDTINSGGSVGRELEFLGQEMHREANTMGAKVNDAQLSSIVTSIKSAVDKVREQVLNIE